VRASERPLSAVPAWIAVLLAVTVLAQVSWRSMSHTRARTAEDLPPAPSARALQLASLGEPGALARLAMVWLLAFDARAENALPYQQLDYARLIGWLSSILALDPRSEYPLFAAARVYAENSNPAKMRAMLEFIHEQFAADPNHRWPALAHAALLAKHRLHDLPLARRYAADLQQLVTDPTVPLWAKQMQVFILEDMNELDAARVVLGGMLATGHIRDPEERQFLEERLKELEAHRQTERKPLKR
jgi:hypothetical protein